MTTEGFDEHDPDDWFDEPDTAGVRGGRAERLRPTAAREQGVEEDDWLEDGARPARDRRPRTRVPLRTAAVVGAVLIVLLLGILAAAGVFSSSGTKAETTSTPTTTAARTTPTTTPRAVPVPSTTVKPGDHGTSVTQLQRALAKAGYSPGKADGAYGPGTTDAVKRFQKAQGLTADGIAGAKTLAALRRVLQTG